MRHSKAKSRSRAPGAGTDAALSAALADYDSTGTRCPFKVRPFTSRPIAVDNPQFEGEMIPQPYTVFGGDAGNASEVEVDWIMSAAPTRNTTPDANGTQSQAQAA